MCHMVSALCGPQHFRQSPRCQICLDVLIFFCKFMSGLLSTLQLLTIYKSRTQHNTTLLKGFCFTPLNLNLFSNSSFYLKGSSSYLHIYNSLQPTSCPDKLINRTYYTYNLASNSMSTGILLDHEIGSYLYFHHCTVPSRLATSNLFLLTC